MSEKMTPCKPEDFTVGQKVRLSKQGKFLGVAVEHVFGHGPTGVVTSTNSKLPHCICVRPTGRTGTRVFASYFWEPDSDEQ